MNTTQVTKSFFFNLVQMKSIIMGTLESFHRSVNRTENSCSVNLWIVISCAATSNDSINISNTSMSWPDDMINNLLEWLKKVDVCIYITRHIMIMKMMKWWWWWWQWHAMMTMMNVKRKYKMNWSFFLPF